MSTQPTIAAFVEESLGNAAERFLERLAHRRGGIAAARAAIAEGDAADELERFAEAWLREHLVTERDSASLVIEAVAGLVAPEALARARALPPLQGAREATASTLRTLLARLEAHGVEPTTRPAPLPPVDGPAAVLASAEAARLRVRSLAPADRAVAKEALAAEQGFWQEAFRELARGLLAAEATSSILGDLARTPLVRAALVEAGVLKLSPVEVVIGALAALGPSLDEVGVAVELAAITDDGKARVEVFGPGASALDLGSVEADLSALLRARAPELTGVELVLRVDRARIGPPTRRATRSSALTVPLADLADRRVQSIVLASGQAATVARLGWRAWLLPAQCPHQGMPLDGARLDEHGVLTCPWHGYRFDVHDGSCPDSPCYALGTVELEVRSGVVHLPDRVPELAKETQ